MELEIFFFQMIDICMFDFALNFPSLEIHIINGITIPVFQNE